jgi:hypothetical protein
MQIHLQAVHQFSFGIAGVFQMPVNSKIGLGKAFALGC